MMFRMAKEERVRPGPLLDFGEVSHHLRLGTRVDLGRQEIPVRRVIGSVGRAHEFDRTFQPRGVRLRRIVEQIAANQPNAADVPIQVYEVDQAYFVVDGHKRMALAVREGRVDIDAEVTRFFSRFHVDGQTTSRSNAASLYLPLRRPNIGTTQSSGLRWPSLTRAATTRCSAPAARPSSS